VVVTLVLLNIVISFVLEIYTTVGEDIAKAHVKLEYAKELMDMFETDDQFIEYLQNVMQIGFMGNGNSVVQPSKKDMHSLLNSRASGASPTMSKMNRLSTTAKAVNMTTAGS